MTWYRVISVCICIAIAFGIVFRRRPKLHSKIMYGCVAADALLGLSLELQRDVFDKTFGIAGNPLPSRLLILHITVALIGFILYFPQIHYGRRLLRGDRSVLAPHRRTACAFVVFRLGNLATSFLI